MDSTQFTFAGLFPPNPSTKRAMRVKWSLHPQGDKLAYATQKQLIVRDLADPKQSKIFGA